MPIKLRRPRSGYRLCGADRVRFIWCGWPQCFTRAEIEWLIERESNTERLGLLRGALTVLDYQDDDLNIEPDGTLGYQGDEEEGDPYGWPGRRKEN